MIDITKTIADHAFATDWEKSLFVLGMAFLGSAIGTFLTSYWRERGKNYATSSDIARITEQLRQTTAATEETKAQVQKALWWTQESWKRKYDLYLILIQACEEIADALWEIHSDVQVMSIHGGILFNKTSTDEDAKRLLPHHISLLNAEERGLEKIQSAAIAAQLILNDKAIEALATLRSARTSAIYIANWSYYKRIETRMDGVTQCKEELIKAAKLDLDIHST